jgi:3-deoxy-D-manno-octulosonic-acid transferase
MRWLYSCLFYSALPVILARLYWRGFKSPDYRLRWQERLGFYTQVSQKKVIWFHAVSVGEAEAVFPLVKQFIRRHPYLPILITTTTPTGSARVNAVMGKTVEHVYLPYDIPCAITRFLAHFLPQKAIIMETELWPNLFHLVSKHDIPLYIINARLSKKSYRNYQRISTLIERTLAVTTHISTQTKADCHRFQALAPQHRNIQTVGNIKFDTPIETKNVKQGTYLKNTLFKNRFVWIIASTHEGEESIFLTLYSQLKIQIPELLLVIVPRHPERFKEVKNLIKSMGLNLTVRSSNDIFTPKTDVYLADTMGELKMFYVAADVAFVGGSWFKSLGGHNILEPMAAGIPVLFGTSMRHFKVIEQGVLTTKSALQCHNSAELLDEMLTLYQQPTYKQHLIENAHLFLKQNQGSIAKILTIIEKFPGKINNL